MGPRRPHGARLSQVPLEFQPREGGGHLPKPPKAWRNLTKNKWKIYQYWLVNGG